MNVISAVILAVLAVIGASTVIKAFTQWLFRVREDCSVLLITPVDSAENAEMVLRSAASRLKWGRSPQADDEGRASGRIAIIACRLRKNKVY